MKKVFLAAFVALVISVAANAQTQQVDLKVMENFETAFAGASNVQWTSQENFTKATFIKDAQRVEVFYNPEGNFIATTKQVSVDEMPTFAKRSLAKKYSDYGVTEAFSLTADDETSYFVVAENAVEKVVLKVAKGSISVYERSRKN